MQQIKGSVLKSRLAFVEQVAGKDGVERVLARLDAQDQAALRHLVAIQWCPFEFGKQLDDAIVQVVGHGKPQLFRRPARLPGQGAADLQALLRYGPPRLHQDAR